MDDQNEIVKLRQRVADLEKEIESLTYSVSHDLRAPLRAVQGFALALYEDYTDKLDGDAKHYLQVIEGSTKQMSAMIEAILSLSRVGRQNISPAEIEMNGLVAEIIGEVKEQQPSQVEITATDLPPAVADINLVRQLWSHLLANAVKFSATKPGGRVEVGGKVEDGRVIYSIRDNGIGFDMNYAKRLFWLFHRLHSDQPFEGVGAGLALSRQIVRRHGGEIWAEAKPNEGACFYFSLPEKK